MPYLICKSETEVKGILAQVKGEGWDGWTTIHHHPETGEIAIIMPGYADHAKFGKETLEDAEEAKEKGFL